MVSIITYKNKIKNKIIVISKQIEYYFLPALPYNTIIDIRYLSMSTDSKYVKIYTNNKIYKTKQELWDILSYIIEWISQIKYHYPTHNLLYIDNNDYWIHNLINIIKLKYYY